MATKEIPRHHSGQASRPQRQDTRLTTASYAVLAILALLGAIIGSRIGVEIDKRDIQWKRPPTEAAYSSISRSCSSSATSAYALLVSSSSACRASERLLEWRGPEGPFTFRLAPFLVAAIFVTVFVFDADFHATAGPIFVVATPVVSAPVRAVPASIVPIAPVTVSSAIPVSSGILVAIAIIITVAVHSPVWTHFAVFAALTVAVAATHPPVATHLTIVAPRLVAIGPLIPLLLGILVRLGRNCLRRCDRRFSSLLGD
jgi:hypothetical protein